MIFRAIKKVVGGKLVKVRIDAEQGGSINAVQITGDFFLHPEDALTDVEKNLIGLPANAAGPQISEKIQEALGTKNAAFV
ncbi:lipoate protein ligase C-terminal domain-containing protein, partial [Pseudomonadota bacterium]